MPSPKPIVIIGGGISGLACAWRLRKRNLPVLLLESAGHFGGVIGTIEKDGFRFDLGPQSFMAGGAMLALIEDLGLAGELCQAPLQAPRYILFHGRLVPAPLGPVGAFTTPLFSWKTKLRLLGEPLGRSRPPADDESIAAFVRRKFGEDLLQNLAAPALSGIYAGDTEKLSLRAVFPRVHQFEEQAGSIVRGAIKSRRAGGKAGPNSKTDAKPDAKVGGGAGAGTRRPPRPRLGNFPRGMLTLTQALAAALGDAARFAVEVLEIRRPAGNSAQATMPEQGFEVICREHDGSAHSLAAQAIILATPAAPAGQLLASIEPRFGEALSRIEYAPVAQFSSGYPLKEISPSGAMRRGDELSGFGFLVPRGEGLRLLGTVWNSSLFPERAPEGAASFTSFLGGATDPGICALSEEEIARIARTELGRILRAGNPPLAENVAVWRRAIPQYNIGHIRIVATLKELCAGCPGIFLAGNYFEGPAIPACVEQAIRVADDVAQFVSAAPGAAPAG